MVTLRKFRTGYIEPIVRAVYCAEPNEFFNKFNTGGNPLDNAVNQAVANIGSALCYRIENEFGAIVGFFSIALGRNGQDMMPEFHIRADVEFFRGQDYLQAFWDLVAETYNNGLFTSLNSAYYSEEERAEWISDAFSLANSLEYAGSNYILVKTTN